ncbi:MAG: hypothetical protein FWH06_02230 [Oscillospiraceae bacterium]|nr:hypothetical protein [Oscillospiraceae bacterium]
MRHTRTRGLRAAALALCAALCMSACMLDNANMLLRLPNPPKVFDALQKKVDALLSAGGEYAPPQGGRNRQVFQTYDLNADGLEEALVFMRFPREEKPLRVYIFQLVDGDYIEMGVIAEDAETIDTVRYSSVTGGSSPELIVGWQVGGALKTLTVYMFTEYGYQEILSTGYNYYSLIDMRDTGYNDIVVLRHDQMNFTGSAELFYFEDGEALSTPQARLSKGIQSINRIMLGKLADGYMAMYVASVMEQDAYVTDILTYRDGHFFNVSLNPESEISDETIRYRRLFAVDLNGSGIVCLPRLTPLPGHDASQSNAEFWLTEWRTYDSYGRVTYLTSTYYNLTDGWYVRLPEEWKDNFTVTSREVSPSMSAVTLAYTSGGQDAEPVELCTVYALFGFNRAAASTADERFVLSGERPDVVFSAKLLGEPSQTPVELDKELLTAMFSVIDNEWITGEV